jgi:excinuclease ABC subunit A
MAKVEKNINAIQVRGARTHNLKNINVDISLNKITCVAGPSGSGKSSLAFHTLLTESKRRFINSLPTDMKFFWEIPHTVEVDSIYPVLPAWGLPQHNPVNNSRPVALDVLGGHARLQKIFMELGDFVCPDHHVAFQKVSTLINVISKIETQKSFNLEDVIHVFIGREDYKKYISDEMTPNRSMESSVRSFNEEDPWYELVRVKGKNLNVLNDKLKEFAIPEGALLRFHVFGMKKNFDINNHFELQCPYCDKKSLEVKVSHVESLSPLNALGACPKCEGHGMRLIYDREKLVKDPTKSIREGAINFLLFSRFEHMFPTFLRECEKVGIDVDKPFQDLPESKWTFLYVGGGKYEGFNAYFEYLKSLRYKKNIRIYTRSMQREILCEQCEGTRISEKAGSLSIVLSKNLISYKSFLKLNIENSLTALREVMSDKKKNIIHEKMENTFNKLERLYAVAVDLGLGHLQNTRKVRSMSSSEYQRLLLSKYLSYEGSQSLFVLDEPSLGLTQATQEKMVKYLRLLRDQGNTIIMVEHSEYLKSMADEVIEMGPAAGERGGKILSQGKYQAPKITFSKKILKSTGKKTYIEIVDARIRNLQKKELLIQKNAINWVYGESGTGKTSFLVHLLANEVHKKVFGTRLSYEDYEFKKLKGIEDFKDVILINSGLDKVSSRSTVATFTDLGAFVRKYFAGLEVSKKLNLKEGHFSSNSELGQCSSCEGRGVKLVEMHFMEDVEFVCEDCQGKKLKPYYANISDGNITAYEAFSKPISEILPHIRLTPKGKRIWEYFKILKLDYLSLDRTLTSLSGGERQRLQLLSLLDKKVECTLIIFENLTSGLSYHEFEPLAELLHQLAGSGNTLIVIDQNSFFDKIAQHQIKF